MQTLFDPRVAVYDAERADYPTRPPFHPPERYPEYPFDRGEIDRENFVYHGVRQLFAQLGLDSEHYGSPDWNPLGALIHPGDRIVVKPNLVVSSHPDGLRGMNASVVHGSILRAVLDYVVIAARGEGQITVADSPIKEVDFARVLELTGIGPTVEFLNARHHLNIELVDFRDLQVTRDQNRVMVSQERLQGDRLGYRVIDLGTQSMLGEISNFASRYRSTAAVYEKSILTAHNRTQNLYSIPNRILEANAVISLAKLKTHRKAGVTLSLKNMVGITNEKRWLPHHRVGSPSEGGDLFPDEARVDLQLKERAKDLLITHSWGRAGAQYLGVPLYQLYGRLVRPHLDRALGTEPLRIVEDGDWYGNDTVWRMVHDLNTLLFYADVQGNVCGEPQRRYLSVIDGIIGGMEEGPLAPRPRPAGILLAGFNPVAVDLVGTRLMGFDWHRIPMLRRAVERSEFPLGQFQPEELVIESNAKRWRNIFRSNDRGLEFAPARGWQGHIELGF